MKKSLLIMSAFFGIGALIYSTTFFIQFNIIASEVISEIEKEKIEPSAIAGGIKIILGVSLLPLIGIIISAFNLKNQKGAGWVLLFNILVFLYCIFGGITVLNSWQ
jgi:uncharacterized protein involved in outer membrane biogenesis